MSAKFWDLSFLLDYSLYCCYIMEAAIQAANALPKVELHVHIEGTLEPALAEAIRKQEGTYDDGEFYSLLSGKSSFASSAKYDFQNLREFLALYYANCR